MKIKKFHLKDFPVEKIRILFKDNRKFLDESISYFGSLKKLADFLSIFPQVINHWKKLNLFIPLKHIKKIVDKRKLNWDKLEKEVVAYKGLNLSLIIQNPKLPIIESPELFAVIGHLIGDGSVNKNGIPIYTNSNIKLIDNFQKLIISVFGNVRGKLYKSPSGAYQFRSSKVISDLIKSFYDINFDSSKSRIPEKIKYLPQEFSIAIIKAFGDDEATVDTNHRISFYSTNKHVLLSIKDLLKKKLMFNNVSLFKKSKYYFYLTIKAKDIEKYYNTIGFNHSLKMAKLSKIIEIRKNSYKVRRRKNQTKNEILNLLSHQNLSTEDLTLKLRISRSNVNIPLKELENKGLISQLNKKGQTIMWTKIGGINNGIYL